MATKTVAAEGVIWSLRLVEDEEEDKKLHSRCVVWFNDLLTCVCVRVCVRVYMHVPTYVHVYVCIMYVCVLKGLC